MDELDPALAATIAAIPGWDGLEPEVTPITIGITNHEDSDLARAADVE